MIPSGEVPQDEDEDVGSDSESDEDTTTDDDSHEDDSLEDEEKMTAELDAWESPLFDTNTLQDKTLGDSETIEIIDRAISAVENEDWDLPNFPTFLPDCLPAL
jgi:hypothetical protein